jgi:hypothetical protein
LFSFNLFEFLDKVKLPDMNALEAEMSTDELLDYLAEQSESDSFNQALASDPDTKNDIDTYLDDVGATGTDDQKQRALTLKAAFAIYTSPAGEFVQNVSSVVTDPDFDFSAASDSLRDLMRSAMPPEALSSLDAFTDMVSRFSAANEAYEGLGAVLDGPPTTNGSDAVNWGQTAQNALLSYVVANVTDADQQSVPIGDLYDLATGEVDNISGLDDPFDAAYDHSHVDKIVDAAGLGGVITW